MKKFGQNILISCLIFSGLFFHACNKESELDLDLLSEQWDLISIEVNQEIIVKENKDYFRDNAYVLIFDSDSTFTLNTSVNDARGKYTICDNSKISIYSYHEFTAVGTTNENDQKLTNKLLQELLKTYEYKIQKNKLTLITENGNILFKVR